MHVHGCVRLAKGEELMNLWIIAAGGGLLLVGAGAVYFLVQYVGARMVADEFKAHGWLQSCERESYGPLGPVDEAPAVRYSPKEGV